MNIKDTFLQLTTKTYPHGTEEELFKFFGKKFQKDEFGNLFLQIGDSDVMFTSHLDTATAAKTSIKHVFEENFIKTDGTTILGADDKAGVTIMLYMIENKVPGLYYFFLGEEVGCIGSRKVANKHKTEKLPHIQKVISFDRRGTDSVITFQSGGRCCSEEFGEALSKLLNEADSTFKYKNDPTGVYTDSAQFVTVYPECTNISVGYYSEHTFSERQDISHLEKLAKACSKVDWNSLPVKRDPSVYESKYPSYYGRGYSSRYYDDDDYYGYGSSSSSRGYTNSVMNSYYTLEKEYVYDAKYKYLSKVEYNKHSKVIVNVDFHKDRLEEELKVIQDFLISIEVEYKKLYWDGKKLSIVTDERTIYVTRDEIAEYLEQFSLDNLIDYLDPEETSLKFHKFVD